MPSSAATTGNANVNNNSGMFKAVSTFNWNTVPFILLFYVISLTFVYREQTRYLGYTFLIAVYAFTWVRLWFNVTQFSQKVAGLYFFRTFLEPYLGHTGTSLLVSVFVFFVFFANIFGLGQMIETYDKVAADQGTYVLDMSDTMKSQVHTFNNTFVASNVLFFNLFGMVSTGSIRGQGVVVNNRTFPMFSWIEVMGVYLPFLLVFALTLTSLSQASAFRRLVHTNIIKTKEKAEQEEAAAQQSGGGSGSGSGSFNQHKASAANARKSSSFLGEFWKFRIM